MLVTESAELQLEDLLDRIGAKLQITAIQFQQAEARYQAAVKWLEAEGSRTAAYRPIIYPQGSLAIGTTTKPLASEEFDLDLVLELAVDWRRVADPTLLLELVEGRLREHGEYNRMVERKKRCIRLNYANEFHLDIMPACPDRSSGPNCVVVPDRTVKEWKASNPKGFAEWFEMRARLSVKTILMEAERLPYPESYEQKPPLKRAVQLLKRWRDIHFEGSPKDAPVSIALTTLAATNYAGENSVYGALETILQGIVDSLPKGTQRLVVLNPMNRQEDLSERWNSKRSYNTFAAGITRLRDEWGKLLLQGNLTGVHARLKELFGEHAASTAFNEQAKAIQKMRESNELAVRRGTGLLVGASSPGTLRVPRNTFYGQ